MTHVLKESAKRTLSARELSILRLVAQGKDMRAIAEELGLAYGTCCAYGGRIRQKLNVKRLKSAVAVARSQGERL